MVRSVFFVVGCFEELEVSVIAQVLVGMSVDEELYYVRCLKRLILGSDFERCRSTGAVWRWRAVPRPRCRG